MKRFLIILIYMAGSSANAEKVSYACDAFKYEIEPQLNLPLKNGQVRFIGETLAGFLSTDDFSIAVTQECEKKNDQKVCLAFGDINYCPKPLDFFKFKEIGNSGEKAMISDRCNNSWTKYQKIGESKFNGIPYNTFMEHKVFFQLKNQIYSGVVINKYKPVLHVPKNSEKNPNVFLTSFKKDYWDHNTHDPLREKGLKVSLESYETGMHDEISLTTTCKRK